MWEMKKEGGVPKLKKPILLEGLPGIGNVGKIAVDFIVDELKAQRIYSFYSTKYPHSVFINEKHLVEMPKMEMHHKRVDGNDLLFLTGDIQPIDEQSCHEFCIAVLEMLRKEGGQEVITTGGIGMAHVPEQPHVFCTGNNKEIVKKYADGTGADSRIYGVVGPIVGVSGLFVGLATRYDINAVALLAETFGHPMYLGMQGAKELIKLLNKKLELGIDVKKLDKEIKRMEEEMSRKTRELQELAKQAMKGQIQQETSYIG